MDVDRLRAAAARATPLERRTTLGTAPPRDWERADRRLARWQAQEPFDEADWFGRRLAAAGLDEDGLRGQLAGAAAAEPEPWVDRLIAAFRCPPAEIADEHAFAAIVAPLVTAVREEFAAAGHPVDLFLPALLAELHAVAARTMVLELNVARVTGQLSAPTAEERFREFVSRLADPEVAVPLLTEYPVLARQLTLAADAWLRANGLLMTRLAADLPRLREVFGDVGTLSTVDTGLGDPHRGGQSVARLVFDSGVRLVYKPRPVDVDLHFQQLVSWLHPHLELPLRTLKVVPGDGYGWIEHVTAAPCPDDAALARFYRRSGCLLALLHLVEATDIHGQNLIAAGDQPVLVDLETLLQPIFPDPPKELSGAERLAYDDTMHSVLRPGMLPEKVWAADGHDGTDLSALGWTPGRSAQRDAPELVDVRTDEMRVGYVAAKLGATQARPVPVGQSLDLLDQLGELDAGFTAAYEALVAHRDEVRPLLAAFAQDEVRLLRRDTLEYSSLLRASFHPDLLRDALDRDRHFDRLWALPARDPAALPFVAYERDDLWNNDIPVFTMRADGVRAESASGAGFDLTVESAPLDAVLRKLDGLGPRDLQRQRWFLRSAIAAGSTAGEDSRRAHLPGDPAKLTDRALDHARAVADELVRRAYRGPAGDLAWAGPNRTPSGGWVVAPLGPDFYSGTAGIALFFDTLAEVTGEYRDELAATLATFELQIVRRADRLTGGLSSAGGVLYTLARLAPRWSAAVELADVVLARIADIIATDDAYDVVGGCAGLIGGLTAWHTVRPESSAAALTKACADHLVATAQPQAVGVGWVPAPLRTDVRRPPAGFGHGAAGIAWALRKAGKVPAAARALAYERTLFLPAAGNWRDVRTEDDPTPLAAWCHGAAGVGLSRLDIHGDPAAEREIDIAVATVTSNFGRNFSLCHGDLGNLDLLLSLPDADWRPHAAGILDAIDVHGWVCGMPRGVDTPSLLTGLAGIGYGLLRIAAPADVPSVLTMSV